MRILTWNVQGAVPSNGSIDRITNQLSYIDQQADTPDILLLNEVTTTQRDRWREGLAALGYTVVDSLDWAAELRASDVPPHQDITHSNGNLTAVHDSLNTDLERHSPSIRTGPYDGGDLKHWSTNFPEKILRATVDTPDRTLDIWNVRAVPGNGWGEEKVKILETVYDRITTTGSPPCVLAGDLNAPDDELADGTIVPFRSRSDGPLADRWAAAETNILRGLESEGMVDVFRHLHGYGDLDVPDTSHEGRRIDHLIASSSLDPAACRYVHDLEECGDHAPVSARFAI